MKHVWMSTSTDLCLDARRDLTDLGCHLNVIDGMIHHCETRLVLVLGVVFFFQC